MAKAGEHRSVDQVSEDKPHDKAGKNYTIPENDEEGIQTDTVNNDHGHRMLCYQCYNGRSGQGPGVVLVPGMGEGIKSRRASALYKACHNLGIPFLRYDPTYMGSSKRLDGKEEGKLVSLWLDDANHMLLNHARGKKQILVGYSLGATISIHLALRYPERVLGLVLCSPVFNLMDVAPSQRCKIPFLYYVFFVVRHEVTFGQVKNFRSDINNYKFKLQQSAVPVSCPVRIMQGIKDMFPFANADILGRMLATTDLTIMLIKEGNHFLHDDHSLEILEESVTNLVSSLKDV